jgi:hypothetical protein
MLHTPKKAQRDVPMQIPQRLTHLLLFALPLLAGNVGAQTTAPDATATSPASAPAAPVTPAPDGAMAAKPDRSFAEAWEAPEPWRTDRFFFETSLYTKHFSSNPNHDNHQQLILGEWNITENWLVGGSFFNNSFGQPSEFFYGGYRFRPFEQAQQLYFKVAAGVIHGYKPPYQNKIPFNSSGYAPGIVPSVGYCINRFCSELVLFGTAGMLLTAGVTVP